MTWNQAAKQANDFTLTKGGPCGKARYQKAMYVLTDGAVQCCKGIAIIKRLDVGS
jgi:hypothetical protein